MKQQTLRLMKNFLQACKYWGIKRGSFLIFDDKGGVFGDVDLSRKIQCEYHEFPKLEDERRKPLDY